MKYFIKRDISTNDSLFTVYDDLGKEKFFVINQKHRAVIYMNIIDVNKNKLVSIRQLPIPTLHTFTINCNKKNVKLVFSDVKSENICHFYGVNWHIVGNIKTKNFTIIDVDNTVIASQKYSFNKFGTDFEINVTNDSDKLFAISTSVCIDLFNSTTNYIAQKI